MKAVSVACLPALALAFACSAPAIASPYDDAVAALAPVAYFNMTNSDATTTTSTNGYTLSLVGGAAVTAGSGPTINGAAVNALQLQNASGGQQYATAGGSNPLTGHIANAATIVGWINLATLPSQQGRTFSIAGESTYGDDVDLQIDSDNIMRFYTTGGGGTAADRAFTTADLGQWIFIAASFTADGSRSVYINDEAPTTGGAGGHSPSDAPFYLGESNVFTGRYFDGEMADFALFDSQLTDAQVQGLFAAASLPASSSPAPEPASWAMFIGGFGLIGGALRSRGRTSVRYA